jgi:hypothetical protein
MVMAMSRGYGLLGVGLALVGAVAFFISRGGPPARGVQTLHAGKSAGAPPMASADGQRGAGSSGEVQRLLAELRQRDEMIGALSALANTRATAPSPTVAAAAATELDPMTRAADVLDERMLMSPKNPRAAAAMERELRGITDTQTLGQAKVESLYCGSTMCKVALRADDDMSVNQAMQSLSDRLPKLFGGASIYPSGAGRSAMYLAKSSEELVLDPGGSKSQP